jgi:hypothetical protein
MPVVPGINCGAKNVAATAELLDHLGIREIQLLPYNHLWEAKLPALATTRRPLGIRPPQPGFYADLCALFSGHGVAAHL